jgi:hypothetical protein
MLSTLVVRFSKLRLGIIYSRSYIECVFRMIMNVNKGVKWWYIAEMGTEVNKAVRIKYRPFSALRIDRISQATIFSLRHFYAKFK